MWEDHFAVTTDMHVEGRSATGRATVVLLQLNRALVVAIRREEAARGRFP